MADQPYSYIAAATVVAVLFAYLLWMAPSSARRTAAALLAANLFLWLLGETAVALSAEQRMAEWTIRLTYGVIAFLPFSVSRIEATIDDPRSLRHRAVAIGTLVFAFTTLLILPTDLLIMGSVHDGSGFHRLSGPLFPAFRFALLAGLLADVVLAVWIRRRAEERIKSVRCQYFLVGLAIDVAIAFLDLCVLQPLGFHSHRMFIIPLAVTIGMAALIYPTAHSRLFDLPTALRRSLIFVVLLATLLVPCLGLSLLAEQIRTGHIAVGPSFLNAALLSVAAFVFPRLRVTTERTLEQVLFGARADDRQLLEAASREVTSVLSLSTLAAVTRTTLARAFEDADATLWLRQGEDLRPLDRDDWQLDASDREGLLEWAHLAKEPVVLSEGVRGTHEKSLNCLRARDVELVLALRVKGRTVGLLMLGPRGAGVYTDDDIALVVTLANQVAIALENARLYEELRESREQVNRASRLSSVGILAAGIAHEIRNPLVAVRTFLELFPQRRNDEDFLTTFQQLSLKEVDRITRLITELLTFARTHERALSRVDVAEIAQHVAALLRPEAGKQTVNLLLSCARDVPDVEGDPSQLQQVILNLVLNAIEASPSGGTVTILVQSGRTLRGEAQVRIEVTDDGPGVPREHREAVFTPFFTTKDSGVGLGLAVAHQLVVEHGGTLAVSCPTAGGSTFVVTLPVAAAATAAVTERKLRVVNG